MAYTARSLLLATRDSFLIPCTSLLVSFLDSTHSTLTVRFLSARRRKDVQRARRPELGNAYGYRVQNRPSYQWLPAFTDADDLLADDLPLPPLQPWSSDAGIPPVSSSRPFTTEDELDQWVASMICS